MAYYTKVLQPDERVRAIGRPHWLIFWPSALWLLAVAAAAIVGAGSRWKPCRARLCFYAAATLGIIGAVTLAGEWLSRRATEVVVTNRRVIFKRGLFARATAGMSVSKIETVDVEQTIAGRLLGYGTVIIRGTGAGIEPLRSIGEPLALRNAILLR